MPARAMTTARFVVAVCLAALAASPAHGLRLGGAGAGAEAESDPLQFFRDVDIRDIGVITTNTSEEVSAWLRELGTARVAQQFRPSLQILSRGWRLAIPMTPRPQEVVGTAGCPELPGDGGRVFMLVTPKGDLCMAGSGFQTRAASTMAMFQEAADLLRREGKALSNFTRKTVCISDNCPAGVDFGYSCGGSCTPIPDFTLWKWPEADILPNFTVVSQELERLSRRPPTQHVCGWAGNVATHKWIWDRFETATTLVNAKRDAAAFELFQHGHSKNTRQRLTMQNQTKRWACMIDIPPQGYSGRVPMLLHSGRPLLMVERRHRSEEPKFIDGTFYRDLMKPYVHFIPVFSNFSDLQKATDLALSDEGKRIAGKALKLARRNLTTDAAVKYLARALETITA